MSSKILHYVSLHLDHPAVTATLAGAGMVPTAAPGWFQNAPIQNLYYLLLIPPAATHLYVWFTRHVWPKIKKLFK